MSIFENLKQLWNYRALVIALVARHLSSRYRGSVLGFLWSFLNPLCLMLVYVLVFKYYIRYSEVEHYTVFLFCGLLPWLWFTSGTAEGTSSIVSSGHLITKSMFPAHILPTVSVITNMIHFILALPLLFIFMLVAGIEFHLTLLFLPLLLLAQLCLMLGLSYGLSSLNVQYRDVQHIVGNLLSFLFFLSPILYPAKSVPPAFRFSLELNPLALLTMFYHDLILDGVIPPLQSVFILIVFIAIALLSGNILYSRYRESFAELL